VVKILVGREGVNPDTPDVYRQTPHFNAILGRHERVVKILLEQEDVNPNKANKWGQMPLCFSFFLFFFKSSAFVLLRYKDSMHL